MLLPVPTNQEIGMEMKKNLLSGYTWVEVMKLLQLLTSILRRLAIPLTLVFSIYVSLSVSKHHRFLLSTYEEFIRVERSNLLFVCFIVIVFALKINIVFGILWPPMEDLDHYVRLDEKDYTVPEVSDADYYHYYYCSDFDEDDSSKCDSDGYDEDNDDDDSEDDVDSDEFYGEEMDSEELKRRAENFIARNTRNWKEEFDFEIPTYMARSMISKVKNEVV